MAKFKSKTKAGGGKKPDAPAATRGLVPCAILLLSGMALVSVVFYFFLRSGVR
jgi:hypothetical protein